MKLRTRKCRDGTLTYFIDYRHHGARRYKFLKDVHDQETAEVAFAQHKVRMARGEVGLATDENLTLGECLDDMVSAKEATCTERHTAGLKSRVAQMKKHFGEHLPVRLLCEKTTNAFRKVLREEGDTPPTINKKVGLLRAALAKAVRANRIAHNPLDAIECLSDARPPVWRFLSEDELDALLGVLKDGKDTKVERKGIRGNYTTRLGQNLDLYRLSLFLVNTGARIGEALALKWRDVSLNRKTICLHTTKAATRGRSAKPRHIPLNAVMVEMMKALSRDDEKVFPIVEDNLRRTFERACELAGIGHCRIHDLRHTFASGLAMAGIPLNTIRELLGHTSMTMTLRYAHLCPSVKAEAVEALNYGSEAKRAKVVSVAELSA